MKVLVCEPRREPVEKEIDGTLESMQEIVGGCIEAVYPWADPVALVCNEEGKLMGLPANRRIGGDLIAGTFFLAGVGTEDFISLSDELIKKYKLILMIRPRYV